MITTNEKDKTKIRINKFIENKGIPEFGKLEVVFQEGKIQYVSILENIRHTEK